MRKFIFSVFALCAFLCESYAQQVPDFTRASIYSMRLDAPITSSVDFSAETKAMKMAFDTLNYENHFRKYNAFNAGPRVMANVADASEEEVMAITTAMGRKNPTAEDKRAAAILKQLEADKVANRLVCKWFSKEGNDGSNFDYDGQYTTITKLGLMALSEDDKSDAKQEGVASLDVAKAMANDLLNSTYVIVTDYDFLTGKEMADKKLNEKLAPLYKKLEKAPAMLAETIKSTIESTKESLTSTLEAAFPADMRMVESHSYLFKLVWDSEEDFYANGLDKDFSKADYHLKYVETASGYSVLVTSEILGTSQAKKEQMVAKRSISALDKNIRRLGNKCIEFSPVELLYTTEDGKYYVKCGTQEGLTAKSKVTPLTIKQDKKTGEKQLAVGGSLSVEKGGLRNNNTDADDVEDNQLTEEDKGNTSLQYTILTGSAKNCKYVKLVEPSAYKKAEAKAAKKAAAKK